MGEAKDKDGNEDTFRLVTIAEYLAHELEGKPIPDDGRPELETVEDEEYPGRRVIRVVDKP